MQLTDSEKKAIKDTWIQRQENEIKKRTALKSEAFEHACKIACLLKNNYGVNQVYLYGSLTKDGHFDSHSDIDLFISGWKEEYSFWKMIAEAEDIAHPFPVSIITEKEAFQWLSDIVYKEGQVL